MENSFWKVRSISKRFFAGDGSVGYEMMRSSAPPSLSPATQNRGSAGLLGPEIRGPSYRTFEQSPSGMV